MSVERICYYLSVLLFGSIIVLGESFKLNLGFLSVSLPLLLIALLLLINSNKDFRFYTTKLDILVYAFLSVILFFAVVGLFAGNSVRDILEDIYPLLVFVLLFLVFRSWRMEKLALLWKLIIGLGTIAAIKVILIGILPIEAGWDSFWQAAKEPLPLGSFSRIILRGGDIFLSTAMVYYLLAILRKDGPGVLPFAGFLVLTVIAVFISLSRSSFLADFLAILFCVVLFRKYFRTKRLISFAAFLTFLFILILPFINAVSLAFSIFEARTDAFDNNNISVSFRENENELVREKASGVYYLGNGMGSYFYLPLSGSEKMDGRSIYAHNFNYWLLLKTGIIGLLLFNSIYIISIIYFIKYLHSVEFGQTEFLLLTLLAGGIVVWVISVLANKFSTLSGAVFLSLFVSTAGSLKWKYENIS
jgi:hypothetical protein